MTKTRLHRSELAVPGSNVRMLEKAPELGADVVMLDLEDAVAPDDKEQARINVIDALGEQDWSRCSVSVRINGLDTHYCYRDVVDVIEQAGETVDAIVIPKVSGAGDVHLVATLLTQIEDAMGSGPYRPRRADRDGDRHGQRRRDRHRLPGADGGDDLRRGRLRRVDPEPHRLDRRRRSQLLGAHRRERYARRGHPLGDQWRYPLSRIAVTCRAHGLRPIDGPFGDFTDPDGYLAAARRSAVLGYEGKWAIHPSQIELANEVYTPSPRLVERTRRIIDAMKAATAEGKGAVSLDGRLIDAASIRMAENLLAKLGQIEARQEQLAGRGPGGFGMTSGEPAARSRRAPAGDVRRSAARLRPAPGASPSAWRCSPWPAWPGAAARAAGAASFEVRATRHRLRRRHRERVRRALRPVARSPLRALPARIEHGRGVRQALAPGDRPFLRGGVCPEAAATAMASLYANAAFRRHLEARGRARMMELAAAA